VAEGRPPWPVLSLPCIATVLLASGLLAATLALLDAGRADAAAAPPPAAGAPPPTAGAATHQPGEGRAGGVDPDPVAIRSEAVAIEAPTIPLGKRDDGRLEVPDDAHTAGWWTGRANPGAPGPAIIVGHVDSREGRGAFWELPDLEPGDRVTVDREDGTSIRWRVDRVEQHPKAAFPTEAVYGATDAPTLRLVTCSGAFDPAARSYEDNTIVFLSLDGEQDAAAGRTTAPGGASGLAAATHDGGPERERTERDLAALASSTVRDGRGVPITFAVACLLVAGAAVARELAVRQAGARGATNR
jgi:hypothetical protein